ncbi:MAG: DUF3127 domain-containing protein [Muribaculaceae bacterium]|nr:DUF3127 domain-containing protein [Muribaculaceae bacterium]
MEIEGKIILDIPMMEGVAKASGKPWKKKEWVMETINTQYPRKIHFHAFNDRADSLKLEVGKVYAVSVDAESREFNGKWYTDLRAYASREVGQSVPENNFGGGFPQGMAPASQLGGGFPEAPAMPAADSTDDLPF